MKIVSKKTEKLENSAEKLTVTIDKNELHKAYSDLLNHYAKEATVKGFRKGKTPVNVIENRFGEIIKGEAVMKAIDETWKELVDAGDVKPLPYAEPKLADEDSLKPDWENDFIFSVSYDVEPEITVAEYKNIETEVPKVTVEDSDIQKELEKLQDQNAMVVPKKSGAVEKNDIVTIDYSLLDDEGNVMPKSERQDFVFTVGSGYNLYKLDDDIIGMKKDEEKVVKKSFGEDENAPALKGQSFNIKVKIKEIKVKELPAIDDDLAQDINEKFKTLDDLKADIKDRLTKAVETKLKGSKIEAILNKITSETTFELPQSMIAAEQDNAWQNFLAQNNLQEDQAVQILKYQGKTKEDIISDFKEAAVKNLKDKLVLKAVIKAENLKAEDADYEARYGEIAKAAGKTVDEIKKVYDNPSFKPYLAEEILNGKAVDFLIGAAKIKTGKKTTVTDFLSM
ncbi:MAG: trigger factor [Spirochaetia bacterium]|nr:trigger factor [Spirochaetia bacterium]